MQGALINQNMTVSFSQSGTSPMVTCATRVSFPALDSVLIGLPSVLHYLTNLEINRRHVSCLFGQRNTFDNHMMLFPQLFASFQENDVFLLPKTTKDQNQPSPYKIRTKSNGQMMRINILIRENLETRFRLTISSNILVRPFL